MVLAVLIILFIGLYLWSRRSQSVNPPDQTTTDKCYWATSLIAPPDQAIFIRYYDQTLKTVVIEEIGNTNVGVISRLNYLQWSSPARITELQYEKLLFSLNTLPAPDPPLDTNDYCYWGVANDGVTQIIKIHYLDQLFNAVVDMPVHPTKQGVQDFLVCVLQSGNITNAQYSMLLTSLNSLPGG